MVHRAELPLLVPLTVGTVRFGRRLALIRFRGRVRRGTEWDSGARVVRVEVEEVVGLRSNKVV